MSSKLTFTRLLLIIFPPHPSPHLREDTNANASKLRDVAWRHAQTHIHRILVLKTVSWNIITTVHRRMPKPSRYISIATFRISTSQSTRRRAMSRKRSSLRPYESVPFRPRRRNIVFATSRRSTCRVSELKMAFERLYGTSYVCPLTSTPTATWFGRPFPYGIQHCDIDERKPHICIDECIKLS